MNGTHQNYTPFDDSLDLDLSLAVLREATQGSEDGELFLERSRSEQLVYDDQRLRAASYNESEGFGLRAVAGEVSGYAHSNAVNQASLKRAAETVRFAVKEEQRVASPAPPSTGFDLYPESAAADDSGFAARVELLKEIDAYLRSSDNRVVQASASLSTSQQDVVILRPRRFTDF